MLTIDKLRAYGADVTSGMARCINNEDFYLKMVNKFISDQSSIDRLTQAVNDHDLDEASEAAHALKGILSNLALTPVLEPVSEMVELLRDRADTDYSTYMQTIHDKMKELTGLTD